MDSKLLIKRTTDFAHRAVKLSLALPKSTLGRHISGQLIRCSTSVAAKKYRATVLAQSRAAFRAKLSIVLEEIDESQFWIEFLVKENLMTIKKVEGVLSEAGELRAIFYATRKTLSKK